MHTEFTSRLKKFPQNTKLRRLYRNFSSLGNTRSVPVNQYIESNGVDRDRAMSASSRTVPVQLIRKTSVDDFNEKMIGMLDEVEKRVEMLRESASQLEQEKESLIDVLGNVNLNAELLRLGQGDRDDINATASRLMNRCKAVEVVVNTPRNDEQTKALNNVNSLIEAAMNKVQEDLNNTKEMIKRYLNACSPEQPDGPIDQRFQAQVIECTADDQKKIRRRLTNFIAQIERTQRHCMPIV